MLFIYVYFSCPKKPEPEYAYVDVVRGKEDRRKLKAFWCQECADVSKILILLNKFFNVYSIFIGHLSTCLILCFGWSVIMLSMEWFNLFSCLHNYLRSPGYPEAYIHLLLTNKIIHFTIHI